MKTKKQIKPEGYGKVLDDIRFLLDKAKARAYKAVDNIRTAETGAFVKISGIEDE